MGPNKENIKLWADALESGEYKQGEGCLKRTLSDDTSDDTEEYCCLGVATVVALKAGVHMTVRFNGLDETSYDGEYAVLPVVVQRWLGVDVGNPELIDETGLGQGAYWWNDQHHKTFPEIAAMIRDTFLKDDQV